MDYDEDRSQIHTAAGPRIMASLRNIAITILRLTGATNIAAALRHHARRPGRPLQTIMNCLTALPCTGSRSRDARTKGLLPAARLAERRLAWHRHM
jgi:hypothetical protein